YFVDGGSPAQFEITIRVPLPHRAVAQGKRIAEKEADGIYEVTYRSSYAMDGMVVVTGPWHVEETNIDGDVCRTYLYEEDRKYSQILIDTLVEELPRFKKIFGALPEGRFDVVENFFATGSGFPQFTLLGDTVIRYVAANTLRKGGKILPSGYLDHELVHCWLGNYLHVDYAQGNWCEALTTYFSNYGAAVREGRGLEYRRKVVQSYSLRVTPENDYPLRDFKSKQHAFENDIGYSKGALVFEMLAQEIGRDAFAKAVNHAVKTRAGRRLGWDGLVEALGEGAGRDLRPWFEPWLERTGGPTIGFGRIAVADGKIWGSVRQTQAGPAYSLAVPVRVTTEKGVEEHIVRAGSRDAPFVIATEAPPLKLELDPEFRLFRVLPRERAAPCLEAVRSASKSVGYGNSSLLQALKIEATEPALPKDAAVLAIGPPPELRAQMVKQGRRLDRTLAIGEGSFTVGGETYDQPGDALLFSYDRREAPPVTFFHGNAEAAYARVRYLPYYGFDSWVAFRDGLPAARGVHWIDHATEAKITAGRNQDPGSLLRALFWLTDTAHDGRRAGTGNTYNIANHLRGRLHKLGFRILPWPPVEVPMLRLPGERTIALLDGKQTRYLEDAFYPFHLSAVETRPTVFERVVEHPAKEIHGNLVLLPEDASEETARNLAEGGASAVAVVSMDAAFTKRGADAAWPGAIPPAYAEQLRKRNQDPELVTTGKLARALPKRLPVPYLYLHPDAAAALRKHGKRGVLQWRPVGSTATTSNVVGVLGAPARQGVLLSAHYDGVGRIDGVPAQGAADNAAGVAVVLWVAEQLKRDSEAGKLKRPVVVAFFGAEEVGLLGSTQFARIVTLPKSPVSRPLVAINVDGVGSHAANQVFLIGRSKAPQLFERFQKALQGSRLETGRDIDRFAFRLGSDHWPLHEAGIPAVTVYSADYRSMNTLRDTVDRIDRDVLQRIAQCVYRMVLDLATAEDLK
ncbi:MAG: M28 family peptidase, partial [Planctomycetota bacterium]